MHLILQLSNIDKDWILTYLLGIIIGVVRSVKYLYSSLHRLKYHIVIFKRSLYQYGITFDSVKNYSMLIVTRKILTKMQSIENYYLIVYNKCKARENSSCI